MSSGKLHPLDPPWEKLEPRPVHKTIGTTGLVPASMQPFVDLNSGSGFVYGRPSPAAGGGIRINAAIDAARKRGETSMPRKLAGELLDASESRGGAVKKREDTHRMADANKAFAHYRW